MQITTPTGKTFQLYDNEVITLDLFSSLFTTDGELKGSYSFASKAPLLPNKEIIAYADLLETKNTGQISRLHVRIGNIYWTDVNMQFTVVDDQEIEFNLTLNLSFINDKIKNTKLGQVPFPYFDLGGTVAEVEANMKTASEGDFGTFPFVFAPVSNPDFTGGQKDSLAEGTTAPPIAIENTVNTFRIESGEIVFNAPNRLETVESESVLKHHAVPFFSLVYVLQYIVKWLGFVPDGPVFLDENIKRLVIYNINTTYISTRGLSWVPTSQQMNMFVSAADHLPNISIADLFKTLAYYPGIFPIIKLPINALGFHFKNNIQKFPVLDWRKKVTSYDEISPTGYGGYHIYMEGTNDVDVWTEGENQDEVKTGRADNKVEIKTILLSQEAFNMSNQYFDIPLDSQPGNVLDPNFIRCENFTSPADKRDFKFTLLFYNGYQDNGSGIMYPQLATQNSDTGVSLSISGNQGVYETYLKTYMQRVEGAKAIKANLLLTPLDMVNWRDDSVVILPSTSGAHVRALLSKLSCDVRVGLDVIPAVAEGIVLDSTEYLALANDLPFLLATLENFHIVQENTTDWKRYCDIRFELFSDRDCQIPYTPSTPIIFEGIILSRYNDFASRDASISSEGVRFPLSNQTTILEDFLQFDFKRSEPAYYLTRKFRVNDTRFFYALPQRVYWF